MLSALWDKPLPAGQTFPISIHERWRPCASARLHLFLCYYIFARPLTLPSLYITSVLSCACSRLADLLPSVNSGTSQKGFSIVGDWDKPKRRKKRSRINNRCKWSAFKTRGSSFHQSCVKHILSISKPQPWLWNHFLFFCIATLAVCFNYTIFSLHTHFFFSTSLKILKCKLVGTHSGMNVYFYQEDQNKCISFYWTTLVVFWPWLNLFWLG